MIYQQAAAEAAKQKEQQGTGAAGPETGPGPSGDKVVDSEDYKVK